jgi:hypothetical protein
VCSGGGGDSLGDSLGGSVWSSAGARIACSGYTGPLELEDFWGRAASSELGATLRIAPECDLLFGCVGFVVVVYFVVMCGLLPRMMAVKSGRKKPMVTHAFSKRMMDRITNFHCAVSLLFGRTNSAEIRIAQETNKRLTRILMCRIWLNGHSVGSIFRSWIVRSNVNSSMIHTRTHVRIEKTHECTPLHTIVLYAGRSGSGPGMTPGCKVPTLIHATRNAMERGRRG